MENLAFHSFTWKVTLPILHYLTLTFPFQSVGRMYFLNVRLKGLKTAKCQDLEMWKFKNNIQPSKYTLG